MQKCCCPQIKAQITIVVSFYQGNDKRQTGCVLCLNMERNQPRPLLCCSELLSLILWNPGNGASSLPGIVGLGTLFLQWPLPLVPVRKGGPTPHASFCSGAAGEKYDASHTVILNFLVVTLGNIQRGKINFNDAFHLTQYVQNSISTRNP